MKLNRSYKIALVALLTAQSFWAAAQTNINAAPDYSAFSTFIAQRNIFDPDRVPNVPWTQPKPRPTVTSSAVRQPDSFSLVGIIGYGEGSQAGAYAFFDGSAQQYRKTEKLNGNIASFKVADIAADSVTLVSGTNKLVLGIGEQLQNDTPGHWQFENGTTGRYNTSSTYGNSRNSGRNGNNNGGGGRRRNNNFGGGNNGNLNNGNSSYDNSGNGSNGGNFNRINNYPPSAAAPDNSQTPDANTPIIVIPSGLVPDAPSAPDPDPQNN
jgi:hypothetical protein